jgi:methyl-accepting chemotaxis protein PixJ
MPQNPYGSFDSTNNLNSGTSRETELIGILGDHDSSYDSYIVAESDPVFSSMEAGSVPPSESGASVDGIGATGIGAYGGQELGIVLSSDKPRDAEANLASSEYQTPISLSSTSPAGVLAHFGQLFRQAGSQEDVLKILVRETRQIFDTDRTVVFRLNKDLSGVVVQESVAAGFTQALGKHIVDPCFQDWYAKYYREGKVTVINSVKDANFARCYIEALGRLEVKANIVAPLIEAGDLIGLLVSHQCSKTREWTQTEIDLYTQIAIQGGLALERSFLLAQRQAETKKAELQADITRLLHRDGLDLDSVLETAVVETRRALLTDRAVVFRVSDDSLSGMVSHESVAPDCFPTRYKEVNTTWFKEWYAKHYKGGKVTVINDINDTSFPACYIQTLQNLNVKANLVAAIVTDQKLYGLLVVHQCSRPRTWQTAEIELFSQIALQTGVALDRAALLSQRKDEAKKVESQLEITKMLHQEAREMGDVLKTTVLETRQSLRADRVMILRLNQDLSGLVTQESVAPGLPKAFNKQLPDPFLREWNNQLIQDIRAAVINDVLQANYAQYYLDIWKSLEVKAVLAAPIITDDPLAGPQLYGLLVAHQCSETREWKQSEVDLLSQVAIQSAFALERACLQLERTSLQLELEGRGGVSPKTNTDQLIQMIRQPVSEEVFLKEAVEEIRQTLSLNRAMFVRFNEDWSAIVHQESVDSGSPEVLYRRIEDPSFQEWYLQHYKEEKVYAVTSNQEASDHYIKALEQIGATAFLVAPIAKGEKLYGLLIGQHSFGPRQWPQAAIDAFRQVAVRVNFLLEQKEKQEKQEAVSQEQAEYLAQGQRASEALTVIGTGQEEIERQRQELQQQQEELMRQKQELAEQGEAARKALMAASLDQKTLREQREVLLKQRSVLLKQRKDLLERLNRGKVEVEAKPERENNVLDRLRRLWPPR